MARPQLKTYIADALHDLTDKASKYSMPPDFTSISFQWHFLRLHFNSNITEEQQNSKYAEISCSYVSTRKSTARKLLRDHTTHPSSGKHNTCDPLEIFSQSRKLVQASDKVFLPQW